ncbi:MAG: polysaccharide deacetylase family protein [Parcubacteria group bacterium]|jgi:peptidoglycan/xylan/chitin deacetylase (PgdA/CDA1 family)
MAKFHVKIIKAFFILAVAMLVLAMVSGINIIRNGSFPSRESLEMEIDYLRYKNALGSKIPANSANPEVPVSSSEISIPVLLYHGVIKNPKSKTDETNISLEAFRDQMFALKKLGYRTITMSDFYDFMKNGKKIPKKSFLLTFDDGRRDSYYPVDPLLRALGYNAVMFAITGQSFASTGRENQFYLSLSELQKMERSGRWEIESHGDFDHDWEKIGENEEKGHFISNRLWLSEQNREETEDEAKKRIISDLENSKAKIKKYIGTDAVAFAFPFNDYGQEEKNFPGADSFIEKNIGRIYPLNFYQVKNDDPVVNYFNPKQIYIKRIDVNTEMDSKKLINIFTQNQEKYIPFSDSFWKDQGWISRWGKKRVWGDLEIGDEIGEKSGNLTILLGTRRWNNYSIKSTFRIEQGNSLSQVVKYKDDNNYSLCNFSASEVSIVERRNGKEYTLAESAGVPNLSLSGDNFSETLSRDGKITCFLNGVKYVESGTDTAPGGEIGFYFWDDLPGNSFIRVKKIEVIQLVP